ncbi:M1 family aminopeptidase [Flagellimonas sp. 2504JD1-5]
MIRCTILIFALILGVVSCSRNQANDIQYQITSLPEDSIPRLQVVMSFLPSQDGVTVLEYPNAAWGQENLHNAIKHMEIRDVKGEIEVNKDSGWITLKHPKNLSELQFEYVLQQDFPNPITSQKIYRPIIQPEYFHLFSHNLFMMPLTIGDTLNVHLDWKGLSANDVVHNSFGNNEKKQTLEAIPRIEFLESIFVGGDFTIEEITIKGNRVYLATRGNWIPFSVDEVKDLLQETLEYQRNFWNDHSQEYFTVTMQPFPLENGSSFQGTGLTNSFATSVSNNDLTQLNQIVYLFNHELMHNWIGHAIHNDNEEEQYWFSEGFTEYYTFKNIAKNGINDMSTSYFIQEINRTIRNLHASPVFMAPNAEINYDNFWANPDYSKLPYYRGAVFAFVLDQQIRSRTNNTKNLDDVMSQILHDAKNNGQKVTHNYFVNVVKEYLGAEFEDYFNQHIEHGVPMPLVELFSSLNLDFTRESEIYELGFQLSEDKKEVLSVMEDSNAYKNGLRPGDKIMSRSIWHGNIDKKVELGILKEGEQQKLAFYPVKMAPVPQIIESPENLIKLGF